jgi:osmotically-inducible protein OsmY
MSSVNQPIAQQVYDAIFHNPHLNHRRMHVRAKGGKVTIEGRVESFFEKQMAQEALRKIDGVDSIENSLEVGFG